MAKEKPEKKPESRADAVRAEAASRAEAVRAAVDQAFQVTAGRAEETRGRAQEVVDEIAGAVGRLRDVLDEARPVAHSDLEELRREIRALGERVAALEAAGGPGPAKRPTGAAAAKPRRPKSAPTGEGTPPEGA